MSFSKTAQIPLFRLILIKTSPTGIRFPEHPLGRFFPAPRGGVDKPDLYEHDLGMRRNKQTHIRDIVPDVLNKFCKGEPVTHATDGVMRGIPVLDSTLGCLRNGELITIAGRPSTGKTTIAARIIAGVSALAVSPITTAVFSLEEAADHFTTRILSAVSGTDLKNDGEDELTDADRRCLHQAADRLSRVPIIIDDTPGISLQDLTECCPQISFDVKRNDMPPLGLVLVDYIQLLRSGKKHKAPADEVSRVAIGLKSLAKDLDVPIVVLSQLSRKVEERTNRRPILSDLNPTLTDASDVVLLLSRGAAYSRSTCASLRNGLEIRVAKHPNGKTEHIEL